MNNEEILALPAGRELDALIWKFLHNKPLTTKDCRYVDGDVQPCVGQPVGHTSPDHYSTNISAAWEVVDYLYRGHTLGFQVIHWPGDGNDWIISFGNGQHGIYAADGNTAPLAICRAALLTTVNGNN